ncbi:MAG: hypothetical protein LH471_01555 [Salinibacterium sp.]|nr:hypothetical protein [Salinibacterium sp.]
MAEDLIVTGPSGSSVATDELLENAYLLDRLADEAAAIGAELNATDRLISMYGLDLADAPANAARAELDIDQAQIVMVQLELGARGVSAGLKAAADGYSFVEQLIAVWGTGAAGGIGGLIGSILPSLVMATLPATAGAAAGIAAAGAVNPAGRDRFLAGAGREASRTLTSAAASTMIRHVVSSADNAILAALRVPAPAARLLGDVVPGTGLSLAARSAVGLGALGGLLTETPVRLADTESHQVDGGPSSIVERLNRIPAPVEGHGAQVVIERYSVPSQPDRFAVYVAGTVSTSAQTGAEPWDLASNLHNAIGAGSGSYEAVVQAMKEAGVTADSAVQLTGYSQGASVAALIAASGDYNVHSLASFGGPIGQMNLPAEMPTVIVEHRDDIIPALGGYQSNHHALVVEREAFAGREVPTDGPLPAHQLDAYLETARLMDLSHQPRLTAALEQLVSFSEGATSVTATTYRFERVMDSASLSAP